MGATPRSTILGSSSALVAILRSTAERLKTKKTKIAESALQGLDHASGYCNVLVKNLIAVTASVKAANAALMTILTPETPARTVFVSLVTNCVADFAARTNEVANLVEALEQDEGFSGAFAQAEEAMMAFMQAQTEYENSRKKAKFSVVNDEPGVN